MVDRLVLRRQPMSRPVFWYRRAVQVSAERRSCRHRAGGKTTAMICGQHESGDAGSPPAIKPGETLVFAVDALRVRHR